MSDYLPVYSGGVEPFTVTTSDAVIGGRLVEVSGDGTVAHAAALSTDVLGVAAYDVAAGRRVTVWPLEGVVHELEAAAAVAAGAAVEAADDGQVQTVSTGEQVGLAMTTAAGSPLKLRLLGRR